MSPSTGGAHAAADAYVLAFTMRGDRRKGDGSTRIGLTEYLAPSPHCGSAAQQFYRW